MISALVDTLTKNIPKHEMIRTSQVVNGTFLDGGASFASGAVSFESLITSVTVFSPVSDVEAMFAISNLKEQWSLAIY